MAGDSVSLRQLLLKLSPKVGDRFPYRRPKTPKVIHSGMQLESLLATSNQGLDHADDDFAWTRDLIVHGTIYFVKPLASCLPAAMPCATGTNRSRRPTAESWRRRRLSTRSGESWLR